MRNRCLPRGGAPRLRKYWEKNNKDFAVWGIEVCNGYHENSKDFTAWDYEDRNGYHQDIEDRAIQDSEHL